MRWAESDPLKCYLIGLAIVCQYSRHFSLVNSPDCKIMESNPLATLSNKTILLGISGGIAAYKCAELVRLFRQQGAEVHVVMTTAAQEFVTPLTLQALSGNPVHTSLLDADAEAGMGHIELARQADVLLIAPATADLLAKLAQGQGSDLLTTLVLASRAPLVVAPAMNQAMWLNPATQRNMVVLRERGAQVIGPAKGEQACGDVGPGRMEEPQCIVRRVAERFETRLLSGKRVLITAGPTLEPLDPVRFLSNRSSGKMGYALAQACVEAGARVSLVSGPTSLAVPAHVKHTAVSTALEMHAAALEAAADAEIVIAAAAVADYRPKAQAKEKIKKGEGDTLILELVKNPDIISAIAQLPGPRFLVGFAAETDNLYKHAQQKLERKGLDAIIANDVAATDTGFEVDHNAVTVIARCGETIHYDKRSKAQLARDLVGWIASRLTE